MRGEQGLVAPGAGTSTIGGTRSQMLRLRVQVTELQTSLDAARTDAANWRQLIETMPQIVWITRPDGWHTHFNHKWSAFTGLTLEESLGFGWNPPFHPDDRQRAALRWKQATSSGDPYEIEYRLRRADGEYRWMLGRAMPLHDADGDIVAWFGTCTDIEDLKRAQAQLADQAVVTAGLVEELHHKATHDPLTGLPNRELLARRLEETLAAGGRGGAVALVLCDLDDFKDINDALGHLAGDQVLCEVARRLRTAVRDRDLVARLGGDEFAILLADADDETLDALGARLLAVVPRPVTLDNGQPVEVGLSLGVARATPCHDAQTLLRDADAALYHAKRRGKGRAERFDADLRVDVIERLAVPQQLRAALSAGGDEVFCLHQPEIHLTTGELFASEALVRWQHPERGLLTPDRFVPLAETAGLTRQLFAHVLADTLATQQRWARSLGAPPAVSVNLSARDLSDATLPDLVAAELARAGTPAELLWLEVTETGIADASSAHTLEALHDLGIHLAIDDFGTGWSSLHRLAELPFDLLKIDRRFTAALTRGGKTHHLVQATIAMAHALGMLTVAEGIETEEQLALLVEMGCDVGQGFHFARPLPADQLLAHLPPRGS